MEYPLNVNVETYRGDLVKSIERLSDFTYSGNWTEVLAILEQDKSLVNRSRLPRVNGTAKLYTPLHQAAYLRAPKAVFEKLLAMGASKTLKTYEGKTAYDIAKQKELFVDILKLLEVPETVTKNANAIQKMEKALHDVIKGRADNLIEKNGLVLPNLGFLYEFGSFWFPVPGMYGGFNVEEHEKGIQTSSWCRVAGGSGQRHVIDREGNVELVEEGFV